MTRLWILLLIGSLASGSCAQTTRPASQPAATEETLQENAQVRPLNVANLSAILGMEGQEQMGLFKITVPQNDLNVLVDGFKIIPPMGLGSWVAFIPTATHPMIMGDIVVTETDLAPVQQEVINQGLTITAIHNHFVRNEPDVMYMHIGGMASEGELARKVKAVLDKVQEVRGGNPSEAATTAVENRLDTAAINRILGFTGSMNQGVYKITIGRPDVDLREGGTPINSFAGFNTWASWQGTPEKAAVAGDFAMTADEVAPVIKALIEHDIEVVAVHNHMVHETPRIFFLHYWGVGPADKLAQGLRAALDETGVAPGE